MFWNIHLRLESLHGGQVEEILWQIPSTNALVLPREVSNHGSRAEGLRRVIVCFRTALCAVNYGKHAPLLDWRGHVCFSIGSR